MTRRAIIKSKDSINLFLAKTKAQYCKDLAEFENWYKKQHMNHPEAFPWEDALARFAERWVMWRELKYGGEDDANDPE